MAANITQTGKADWKPINTMLPEELWRRLKADAALRGIEVRELLAEIVTQYAYKSTTKDRSR